MKGTSCRDEVDPEAAKEAFEMVTSPMTVLDWVSSPWHYTTQDAFQTSYSSVFKDGEGFSAGCIRCSRPFYEYTHRMYPVPPTGSAKGSDGKTLTNAVSFVSRPNPNGPSGERRPYDDPVHWERQEFTVENVKLSTQEVQSTPEQTHEHTVQSANQHGWETYLSKHKGADLCVARKHNNVAYNSEKMAASKVYSTGAERDKTGYYIIRQGRDSKRPAAPYHGLFRNMRANKYGNVCQDCALALHKQKRYELVQPDFSKSKPGPADGEVRYWWTRLLKGDLEAYEAVIASMHRGQRQNDAAPAGPQTLKAMAALRQKLRSEADGNVHVNVPTSAKASRKAASDYARARATDHSRVVSICRTART